jgi:hypothetical protein
MRIGRGARNKSLLRCPVGVHDLSARDELNTIVCRHCVLKDDRKGDGQPV